MKTDQNCIALKEVHEYLLNNLIVHFVGDIHWIVTENKTKHFIFIFCFTA